MESQKTKIKIKKCPQCGKSFELKNLGRINFYTTKFCSKDCFVASNRAKASVKAKKQLERNAEKFKALAENKGKAEFKCKNCKKKYLQYVSQARHRGTNYCSLKCKKETLQKRSADQSVSQLKKKLWNIFSRYIRLRDAINTTSTLDRVACVTCGEIGNTVDTDAGHFQSRVYTNVLFDEHNVHGQCKKCNMPPRSGEQYLYSKRIIQMYGEGELERIMLDKKKEKRFSKKELIDMMAHYKGKVVDLIGTNESPWRTGL